jgi:hypothetical protein
MSKFEILQSNKIDHEIAIVDNYQRRKIHYNKKMSFLMNLLFRVPGLGMDLFLFLVFLFF